MEDKSYIGKGKVYLDGRFVGNVTELKIGGTEDKKELKDYTSSGGGNYNSVSRVDAVTLSLVASDFSKENIALALFGSTTTVAAGAIVDESITSLANGDTLVKTANLIDTTVAPVVTSDPAGTTYTVDVDYTVSAGGIVVLSSGSIPASTPLLISYTKVGADVIELLTGSGQEYVLDFDGLNEAQSDTPVFITVHRAKFGPTDEMSMIGDDFGSLTLSGDALKDPAIVGAGLSQYVTIKQV